MTQQRSDTGRARKRARQSRGKGREATLDPVENPNKQVNKAISERTKRSWETRRAKSAREGIEEMVNAHGDGRDQADQNEAGTSYHSQSTIPLPTSEFLLSIHHHSSEFYTSNELLFHPSKKGRTVPWGSKKRLLILQDADPGLKNDSRSSGTTSTRSKSRSRSTWRTEEDEEQIEEPKEDELDDDNDENVNVKKELVDEYGEIIVQGDRQTNRSESANGNGRKERSKGRYKKRDMYMAIEGEGLMALGILLQHHIIQAIHTAGYRKRDSKSVSEETGSSRSGTAPLHTSKGKGRKSKKRKDAPSVGEEEEEREMESEEGQESGPDSP
ncbi:hypothetical protein L486_02746 [Kwoniella mangroviensis CBS 10435]|uniref:Uncharacterized protein n=1 Tax=Kwoniella mangroviensis CBS 10435 TaxID=1331196 RepID=A0A1B9IX23_9TREE|nr:hypothetical protein L486_02746 [Kwoniella mangroviensis CBS 10435]